MLNLYLHSYSFRFHYRRKPGFDVFAFIDEAARAGFSGVNITAIPPYYRYLSGRDLDHLDGVRSRLEARGMRIDLETRGTNPAHLVEHLGLAARLGAGSLRTYTTPSASGSGDRIDQAVADLKAIIPTAERVGIPILLENHEDMTGREVADILECTASPWIGALFDYGNSMVFMDEPLDSLRHLKPWVRTAHMKDHVVLAPNVTGTPEPIFLGVPLGEGNLPVIEISEQLISAGVDRLCLENCWAYQTRFQDRRGPATFGEGEFRFCFPPFEPSRCLPDAERAAERKGMDLVALERAAFNRSVAWFSAMHRRMGIILARPLRHATLAARS